MPAAGLHVNFDARERGGAPNSGPEDFDSDEFDSGDTDSGGGDSGGGASELVRLNKYLADHGVASRRKCDELIVAGKVTVDEQVVTELGLKIDPAKQRVEIDGVVLKPERTRLRYYLLHKPRGVVCTNERREARLRAIDLITDPDKGRIYTVGRLDEDSQGLILLTNDGDFANRVAHPRYGVKKTYSVKLRGRVEPDAIEKVRKGIWLAEGRTAPAFVKVLKRTSEWSLVTITLNEGKNREVRRVFAAVGYNVLQLRRTHIGTLSDRSLKEGRWRPLLREELRELLEQAREGAAPDVDRREDPRTQHFKEGSRAESGRPFGPGRERRSPKDRGRWMRDRKESLERRGSSAPAGRRQRGEKREQLREKVERKRQGAARPSARSDERRPNTRGGERGPGGRGDDRRPNTRGAERGPSTRGDDRRPNTRGGERGPGSRGEDRRPNVRSGERGPSTRGDDRRPKFRAPDRRAPERGEGRAPRAPGRPGAGPRGGAGGKGRERKAGGGERGEGRAGRFPRGPRE
jgi:23S rRNA pseudouridine2605 synthase